VTLNGEPVPGVESRCVRGGTRSRSRRTAGHYASRACRKACLWQLDLGADFWPAAPRARSRVKADLRLPIELRAPRSSRAASRGRRTERRSGFDRVAERVRLASDHDNRRQGSFRFDLVPEGQVILAAEALSSIDCARESLTVEGARRAVTLTFAASRLEGTTASSAGPSRSVSVSVWAGCQSAYWNLVVGPSGAVPHPGVTVRSGERFVNSTAPTGLKLYASATASYAQPDHDHDAAREPVGSVQGMSFARMDLSRGRAGSSDERETGMPSFRRTRLEHSRPRTSLSGRSRFSKPCTERWVAS